jgi:hypothetical protein
MDWLALDSRLFTSGAHDPERRILYLRFRGGDVYRYFDFPPEQYQALLGADSRGRHFLSNIRDKYRYERLGRLSLTADGSSI